MQPSRLGSWKRSLEKMQLSLVHCRQGWGLRRQWVELYEHAFLSVWLFFTERWIFVFLCSCYWLPHSYTLFLEMLKASPASSNRWALPWRCVCFSSVHAFWLFEWLSWRSSARYVSSCRSGYIMHDGKSMEGGGRRWNNPLQSPDPQITVVCRSTSILSSTAFTPIRNRTWPP